MREARTCRWILIPVYLGHGVGDLHIGAVDRGWDTLEMGISRDHDEVPLQSRRGDERVNVPYMSS